MFRKKSFLYFRPPSMHVCLCAYLISSEAWLLLTNSLISGKILNQESNSQFYPRRKMEKKLFADRSYFRTEITLKSNISLYVPPNMWNSNNFRLSMVIWVIYVSLIENIRHQDKVSFSIFTLIDLM